MIYIATTIAGRGVRYVTGFDDRADLLRYAGGTLAFTDSAPRSRDSIDTLCELLQDHGPGFPSSLLSSLSRREAVTLLRDGAEAIECWGIDP
jgi:hypothetical protein